MFFKRFVSAILIGASLLTAVSCSQNPLDETALGTESLTPDGSEIETLETLIDTYTTMLNTHTVSLSEKDIELYKNSYDILYNRITDRGYAITSLTVWHFTSSPVTGEYVRPIRANIMRR